MATAMFWDHHDDPLDRLIGESAPMRRLKNTIRHVAATGRHVVLRGEAGVGKELIAQVIHQRSGRVGAFVAVNVGAIPTAVLPECLFGHESEAARSDSEWGLGRFERAHLGTLFIDEMDTIPESLHGPLAHVVRMKELPRIGSAAIRQADVRVVAAIPDGSLTSLEFIEDVFAPVVIDVPPLRERGADALLLARAFVDRMHEGHRLSAEAERRLLKVDLPGNVRQLENIVTWAASWTDGAVIPAAALRLDDGDPLVEVRRAK